MAPDAELEPRFPDTVAVVDLDRGPDAVVWWVALDELSGASRTCGAWRVPREPASVVAGLVAGRWVLPVGTVDDQCETPAHLLMDAGATLTGVLEARAALMAAHEGYVDQLPKGRAVADPTWPPAPVPVPSAAASAAVTPPGVDEAVLAALGLARWLDGLCRSWDVLEALRLSRKHLRALGPEVARRLPVSPRA